VPSAAFGTTKRPAATDRPPLPFWARSFRSRHPLHRKAVLGIASSSVTKFKSTVWQMPICLPFECLCTTTLSRHDTRSLNADAVSRAIGWETAEPSSIGAPRSYDVAGREENVAIAE